MAEIRGFGVGIRVMHATAAATTTRAIDFLEIIPENWVRPRERRLLAACSERWPIVPHSISLSIGGLDPFPADYLTTMREIIRLIDAPLFSDHLSSSSLEGRHTSELFPLPFSAEAIDHTVARMAAAQREFDVPLVLENPTYYVVLPGSTLDEATFLCAVLERSNCGMLLDVNNVFVNAVNHGYDPYRFIAAMPMDRVREIHLAGHRHDAHLDTIVDSHSKPIRDEVWDLYRHTIRLAGRVIPTVVEWDHDVPSFDEVVDQVDLARHHAEHALQKDVA